MALLPKEPDRRRSPSWILWTIAAVLVLIVVIISLNGLVRGGGEAMGIKGAAPGDNNASPASTSRSD